MTLRTKKDQSEMDMGSKASPGATKRQIQCFPLPHGSMFVMGLETNRRCTHAIRMDSRPSQLKSSEELDYNGERISLTFDISGRS